MYSETLVLLYTFRLASLSDSESSVHVPGVLLNSLFINVVGWFGVEFRGLSLLTSPLMVTGSD